MTLPASGQLGFSDINVEIGQASSFSSDLQFLNNQIVPAQRPATPAISNFYNLNWFQNNTQGNCNNGNCTANCNCGNIQCRNCLISGTVNCTNCDAQNWLQTNCNCACTYNCTTSQTSFNCNCNCACACFWSDDRLKNKLSDIGSPLDKVKSLNGFLYEGNELAKQQGLNTDMSVGISAQEVLKVLPEAISKNKIAGEYMAVDYSRLVPLLIEAIKELDVKVEKK
jgi:hypothetical protein